jgi:hypothetical protein
MHGTMIITATSTPTTPACEAARRGAAARRGGGRGHGRGVGRAKPPRTQGRCVVASALACGSCALCRRGVERSGGRAGRGSREGCGERAASERSRTVSKWFGHRVDRQEMRAKTEGGKKTNTGMPPRPHHVAVRHRLQRPALPHTPQQHATRPAGSALRGAWTTPPTTPACKATRGCGGVEGHRARIGQAAKTAQWRGVLGDRGSDCTGKWHSRELCVGGPAAATAARSGLCIGRCAAGGLRLVPEPRPAISLRDGAPFLPARSRPTARIDRADPNGHSCEHRPPELLREALPAAGHRRSRKARFVWQPGPPASRPASAPPAAAPPENLPGCSGGNVRIRPWSARPRRRTGASGRPESRPESGPSSQVTR